MSNLKLVETKDGSFTLLNTALGSTYHSRHGALTESQHVFIGEGLNRTWRPSLSEITVLEMGFGTGLNALLTWGFAVEKAIRVNYHSLELYPVPEEVWSCYELPYSVEDTEGRFRQLHQAKWNESVQLDDAFNLTKHHKSLLDFNSEERFDVVFFDAFEPETQPELWTEEIFSKLFELMNPEAILTTYCCKGYVRRNMISAGFMVEKVPGPPGKREMIVAQRPL
jgi:tRNA U34 5-methylaminomethyl-2-thiouridine-forming methyltransferase MnmC